MGSEYRVVVRDGDGRYVSSRIYQKEHTARRRMALWGPRPWEALGLDGTAYGCCDGHMCGCPGHNHRAQSVEIREDSIERYGEGATATLQVREVPDWQDTGEVQVIEPIPEEPSND